MYIPLNLHSVAHNQDQIIFNVIIKKLEENFVKELLCFFTKAKNRKIKKNINQYKSYII